MNDRNIYRVGDEVYVKSFFNDEPDDIGIVVEAINCTTHMYYHVEYIDQSGRSMRCGTPEKWIGGHVPRIEKVINQNNVVQLTSRLEALK